MLTHIVSLSMFVTISLYISIETTTKFIIFLISSDKHIYHKEIDTRAAARSTIVSDLGLVEYVFYDKTGTLTQNVIQFKRYSVDGLMFGTPVAKFVPSNIGNITEVEALVYQEFHPLNKLPKRFHLILMPQMEKVSLNIHLTRIVTMTYLLKTSL